MAEPERIPLYVHIDADLYHRLKAWCERQGVSMRHVVQEALEDLLRRAEALEASLGADAERKD